MLHSTKVEGTAAATEANTLPRLRQELLTVELHLTLASVLMLISNSKSVQKGLSRPISSRQPASSSLLKQTLLNLFNPASLE